jgi:predicted flap endonuclease-1-like 5' DNA nuclease
MGYLFFQILVWILLAFGLGGVIGWLLRGFTQTLQDDEKGEVGSVGRGDDHIMVSLLRSELSDAKKRLRELQATATPARPGSEKAKQAIPDDWRPVALAAPKGTADDLKKVRGIGPKIEQTLHALGVFHYYQIAGLSRENILWLNNHLHFPGRIEREQWVEQTRILVKQQLDRAQSA